MRRLPKISPLQSAIVLRVAGASVLNFLPKIKLNGPTERKNFRFGTGRFFCAIGSPSNIS
jgi:hypothetical protein